MLSVAAISFSLESFKRINYKRYGLCAFYIMILRVSFNTIIKEAKIMKKSILKFCVVAILCTAVLAISVAAATGNFSLLVSEEGIAERTELAQSYDVKLLADENIHVTYDKSRSVKEGFADIYKDEKGNDYIYKNGKLSGFYSNEIKHPATDAAPIGKDAATEIAEKWLARFAENSDKYELQSFEEKENYGQYYITFARKLGEIFTEQSAEISVMYDGGVKYVSMFCGGKYDNVSEDITEGVTEDEIEAYASEQMSIIYPDKEGNFNMKSCCLEQDENGYYIAAYGDFNDKFETVRYDLEN